MKTIKGSPIMSPMGKMVTPTNRLSISKRFIHTSPTAVQQKPIIIKSRATRTNESVSNAVPSGSKDVPLVIYKSGLAETHNKPKVRFTKHLGQRYGHTLMNSPSTQDNCFDRTGLLLQMRQVPTWHPSKICATPRCR